MKQIVFILILQGILFTGLPAMLAAQSPIPPGSQEMTIEQSYLSETVDLIIIREQSRADNREMKLAALENIANALNRGSKSDEIRAALEYLSLEGIVNVTRENGRIMNNFPDVRKQAVFYLGELGAPESNPTLLKVVSTDNNTTVVIEAMRALGKIAINDDSETARTIAATVSRFYSTHPDNILALSALDTFEKIAAANNGLRDRYVIETITRISEGPYPALVRNRAKTLLVNLRKYR